MSAARLTPVPGAPALAPMAKGSTLRTTLAFIEESAGATTAQRVLGRLTPAEREAVRAAGATDEVPFALARALWRAADAELRDADPTWAEKSGAHSIASVGLKLYGGILRKPTPLEFLTEGISLFRLYYHPGDMEVVERGEGRVVLRLVGFDHDEPLFCRRQSGGLHRALQAAGGSEPRVTHVRCALEGDAFCEWELAWKSGPVVSE